MRVAFVGTGDAALDRYPPGGGIEHQVWLLARELARRGHECAILTRDAAAEHAPGVRTLHVPMRGRGQVLGKLPMSWRAAREVERFQPDVVYFSEKWVSLFPSFTRRASIYATHNKDAFESYRAQAMRDHAVNRVFFPLKRRIEEGEMRRSSVVAANSPGVLDYVRSRGFGDAVLVPMAVDPDEFHEGEEAPRPYIYASGQLLPVKGMRFLVDAFARVAPSRPEWDLVLGGRGPERAPLDAQVRARGLAPRIRFIDWLSREVYTDVLSHASFFVLPSLAETFGTVILDAMASGKSVVATDIPGPRDVVVNGETGLLVPPADPDALASALARLMDDAGQRARMGKEGARQARERWSPRASVEAFERAASIAIARVELPSF